MTRTFALRFLVPACAALLAGAPTPCGAADFIYTVQPGDHPWNLAQRYLVAPAFGPRLRAYNRIPDDRRIPPGTRLRIPHDWLRLESAQVRLLAAHGDTTLAQPDGSARPAVAGELLQAPLTFRTGATGSATLEFADGSRVLVRRDSAVALRQSQRRLLSEARWIEMSLLQGSLENQVAPADTPEARFGIRTPAAVAAVRGTEFRVHAGTDGGLRTEVLSGLVNVANAAGQVNAAAGQGSWARSGQSAPDAPAPLLPAPSLAGLPERLERVPIEWPLEAPPAGAVSYRSQLAATPAFTQLLSDETSPAPRLRLADVEDGSYVLRVRAIDAQGLEGFSAQRTLVVHARPEPPLQIEPAPDAVTDAARPAFRWTQADPAWRYRLQIAPEGGGDPVELEVGSGVAPTPPQDLALGPHRWRVAAIQPGKGQGPWSDAQPFQRVRPGPGVEPPSTKDGLMTLRWVAQPQAARYRLQLARGSDFSAPLADVQTEAPQYGFQDLAPGTYQVRVQALEAGGAAGLWGRAQSFDVPEPPPSHWRMLLLLLPLLLGVF